MKWSSIIVAALLLAGCGGGAETEYMIVQDGPAEKRQLGLEQRVTALEEALAAAQSAQDDAEGVIDDLLVTVEAQEATIELLEEGQAVMVLDEAGHVIGRSLGTFEVGSDDVYALTSTGFLIALTEKHVNYGGTFYESFDCTGQPYANAGYPLQGDDPTLSSLGEVFGSAISGTISEPALFYIPPSEPRVDGLEINSHYKNGFPGLCITEYWNTHSAYRAFPNDSAITGVEVVTGGWVLQ